jgi:putative IMPACT (imprinted ancient) family translation regulator
LPREDNILLPYAAPASKGTGTYRERGSRFVGIAAPISDWHDFHAFLASVHAEHAGADHVAYAHRPQPGCGNTRHADGGEPQGTAGPALVMCLEGAGLEGAAVAVARYYGGTPLGTGNLSRAYGAAARKALAAAGTITMVPWRSYRVETALADAPAVEHALRGAGAVIDERLYENKAVLTVSLSCSHEVTVEDLLSRWHAEAAGCGLHYRPEEATPQPRR